MLWKTRTAGPSSCQLVLDGSKRTAIGSVEKIYGLNQTGILAIVDDDYDSMLGQAIPFPNIIRTETCDIEALMLKSTALESLLCELGDDRKILQIEQEEGRTIREAFLSRALIFGQLRYLNALNKWNVSFEKISPYRFVDASTWGIKKATILEEICRRSWTIGDRAGKPAPSVQDFDVWSVLHGKIVKVLAVSRSTIEIVGIP